MEKKKAIEIFNKWMDCKDAYQADPSCDGNCFSCEYYASAEEEKEAMQMAISALEKQEQDRWHSVAKEGNPKESGLYIVTDNSKMDGNKPHTRYFNAYGEKAFWSGWRADEVVAWKEITSEPYTEEES